MASSASSAEPGFWKHQADELLCNWNKPGRALLWKPRTGKSRTVVVKSQMLHEAGEVAGTLVLAPNGVHSNWVTQELPRWGDPGVSAHYWSSKLSHERDGEWERSMAGLLEHPGQKFFAVNDEALINERCQKAIKLFVRACRGRVHFVSDECSDFRRPGARRTMLARGLAKRTPYRSILDGTALFNSPLHAFSQFELLSKGALGFTTYADFKDHFAVYERRTTRNGRSFPAIKEYVNMDELRESIARWASVVMRGDVAGMPSLLPVTRDIVLSDRQAAAYLQMVEESLAEIGDQQVDAIHGGAKVLKLQQILGGFLIDGDGEVVSVDDKPPILDAMQREVEGTYPGKSIIWCRFREDIRRVVARLREMGHSPVEYHGGIPAGQRSTNLTLFRDDSSVTELVGQPRAGGRGLNMSVAEMVMWYSAVPDAITTEQANERATQVDGHNVSLVSLVTPGTVSQDIVASNEGKVSLADYVSGHGLRDLLRRTRI